MKTILFPTDFSKASEAALKFAIEIAKRSGAKIVVTNTYLFPVLNLDVPPRMLGQLYEEEKEFSEASLMKTCEKISSHKYLNGKAIHCEFVAKHSLPVTEIAKVAEKNKADLIVMGTSVKDSILSLIGSTTVGVINQGYCPVLVIHEDTRYEDLKYIHFAVENIKEEVHTVIQLTELARLFDSEITILHVEDAATIKNHLSMNDKKAVQKDNDMISRVRQYAHYDNINFRAIVSGDISHALDTYMHHHPTSLLVLLKHERSWLENFFHKSVINSLIRKEAFPILIINRNDA